MAGAPAMLAAARSAAARGWPVFPLQPYGKRPAVRDWPHRATCEVDQLERWWSRTPWNVGIACGPARLLVVDLDGAGDGAAVFTDLVARAGAQLTATFTVRTPSGGEHRYYSVPEGPLTRAARSTVGTLGRYVDTRGAGGYVVAAGSVRRVGGRPTYYSLFDSTAPKPLPGWLAQLLTPSLPQPAPVVVLGGRQRSGYAGAAMAGETRRVRMAAAGTRNAVLFDAAVRLGTLVATGLLDEQDVHDALLSASAVHIGVERFTAAEAERAIGNGLRYGLLRPRDIRAG